MKKLLNAGLLGLMLMWAGNAAALTSTTTDFTITPNPSEIGQNVTYSATVTGANPTGTVNFRYYNGSGWLLLGSASLTGGVATLNVTPTSLLGIIFDAHYTGDSNNAASTSSNVLRTVNKATSSTVLTTPGPSEAGQAVTLTATVSGYNPGGTVTFYDNGNSLGSSSLSSGVATLNYIFMTAGSHSLTAVYGGNSQNISSTSAAVAQTVNIAITTTVLTPTPTPNPSEIGQAVTLSATVSGANPGGTITFMDGTTTLGTGTLASGMATLSYTFTTLGTHSLTAVYAGDANNATSTSAAVAQTVNVAIPVVTLTTSGTSKVGDKVTLTATVSGYNPTGTVTFKEGTTSLGTGTLTSGVATLDFTFMTAGTHSLTAEYGGDANNAKMTSAAINQSVNKASTSTTLVMTPEPQEVGQTTTFTATVTTTTGGNPTGSVAFFIYLNGTWTAFITVPVTGGVATFNQDLTPQGISSYYYLATYIGDSNYASSSSGAVLHSVSKATSTTVLTTNPTHRSNVGDTITMTATVSGASPTGTVNFYDNGTKLGSATISSGVAQLPYTISTPGSHSLEAIYGGNAYNTSSSSTIDQAGAVNTTTSLSVTPPSLAIAGNNNVTMTATIGNGYNLTGTVTFSANNGGTVTNTTLPLPTGSNSVTYTSTLWAGNYTLTAKYNGDIYNNTSSQQATETVNPAQPSISLSVPPPGSSEIGNSVTLTATVTGAFNPDNPQSTVTFYDNGNSLGDAPVGANGVATLNPTFTTLNAHNLTARYNGNVNNDPITSATVVQTVTVATTSTVLTVAPSPADTGQAVVLSAAVNGGYNNPSGTVTFLDNNGTTTLGTSTLSSGAASLSLFMAAGSHSLTVVYGGDVNNAGSTSTAINLTVNATSSAALPYYIHTDQIDTPRMITNLAGQVVWQWDNTDPFGNNAPSENPSGQGQFSFDLRFPGQYFDKETNTNYNDNRDYNPATGRYIESDPIGLDGGINTYTYVGGNPLSYTDPLGLVPNPAEGACALGPNPVCIGGVVADIVTAVIGGAAIGGILSTPGDTSSGGRSRGKSDPVSGVKPFNPGKDCDGKCKPCPPPEIWEAPGDAHGSTSGSHWHGIVWNQDPSTCMCYPKRVSGPSPDNLR